VVEYVEACDLLGVTVVAAVVNRPGDVWFPDPATCVDAGALPRELLRAPCVCPLFTPRNRHTAVAEAARLGFAFADALVHPSAILARTTRLGRGVFVNAGAIVGAMSELADHALVNRGAVVGHHVTIEAFASVGPGAVIAGQVTIGYGAAIGAGAVLLPKVTIGTHAVVGAGAVVVRDVPAHAKALGNPARVTATAQPGFERA
jgi:sugar O-acyltransferase (sialic acid O-acetyltransferase NeuD family)